MATKQSIATIKGTFAVPGVSKNHRLYTREAIAGAVNEAQALIDSGEGLRVAMMTNHGARDPLAGDVSRTAGQVTKVGISPDGHGTFEAELADTQAGRDVAALTTPDRPYLRGVSMASVWKGTPRQVRVNGEAAITAEGFSLKGIDFTHNPGVVGASIHSAELNESADDTLIFEELEEVVLAEIVTEDGNAPGDGKLPYGSVTYADPGYQADKKKRYPLDTKAHAQAAWSYVNVAKNAAKYSAKQLNRIKSKIKVAAKKFGVNVTEAVVIDDEFIEAYQALCLDTDAIEATGDVDNDDEMSECGSCGADVPDGAQYCPACGTPISQTESAPAGTDKEGANMPTDAEKTGEATESTVQTFTLEQVKEIAKQSATEALEAAGVKPAEVIEESEEVKAARALIAEADKGKTEPVVAATAPAPVVTEAAPAGLTLESVTALMEEREKALTEQFEAQRDKDRKEIQEAGPRRKGFVPKSILEQSPEEIYGQDADLSKASIQDLEKATDAAFYPLISA